MKNKEHEQTTSNKKHKIGIKTAATNQEPRTRSRTKNENKEHKQRTILTNRTKNKVQPQRTHERRTQNKQTQQQHLCQNYVDIQIQSITHKKSRIKKIKY